MKPFCSVLARLLFFVLGIALLSRPNSAQEVARTDAAAGPGVNLAVAATPSSSFISGDTTVTALSENISPRNSRDNQRGSYGNWPHTGTEWVQYEWTKPISTKQTDVYWWADGQGVGLPAACRVLYWDGNNFVPVANANGLGVERNKFNTTTFDEVTTTKLRLEMDSDGRLSTGVLNWKVYGSGKSPDFPPTVVAGVELDVVYTTHYTIDSPLWNDRAKALIVNWIPHCIDQINSTNIPRGQGDGGID